MVPTSPTNRLFFYRCQPHLQTDCFYTGVNLTYKQVIFLSMLTSPTNGLFFLLVLTSPKPNCFYSGANLTSNTIQGIMSDQHSEKIFSQFYITNVSLGERLQAQ